MKQVDTKCSHETLNSIVFAREFTLTMSVYLCPLKCVQTLVSIKDFVTFKVYFKLVMNQLIN